MEQELINYIKNMFAMESTPTWLPDYEGVIFYDKAAKKWVTGTDVGWKVINRSQATVSGIAPINWIDPFEYENNTALSGTYTVSDNSLMVSVDSTTSTYGNYSMKIDTSSTISGTSIIRNFNPPLAVISDYISFDMKSDTIVDYGMDVLFINSELVNPTILSGAIVAKSVVFDIADNSGNTGYIGIRAIEFYLEGIVVSFSVSDYTAYSTTSYDSRYYPSNTFNQSLSKIGSQENTQWLSANNVVTNQRLIIVFNTDQIFDAVVINNGHHNGLVTTMGAKNVKIMVSPDSITNTTYGDVVSNSTLIFDGQIAAHVVANVIDDQELALIPEDYFTLTSGIFVPTINITDIDTYQKQSFFIADATLSGSIDYLKLVITKPGPIYNIDNMRFDSDQETYWLDVCEYNTDDDVQTVYKTTASGLVVATTDAMVAYGNKAIHISANTMASGVSIYRPFVTHLGGAVAAKSVILDFENGWGGTDMNIRSVEFKLNGVLIDAGSTVGITCYATSTYSSLYLPQYAFTVSSSKIGAGNAYCAWNSSAGATTSQRLVVIFSTSQEFDSIVINNCHHYGSYTNGGVKNTKIYISDDAITNTVYGSTILNSTLVFEGQINQHVAIDQIDDQVMDVSTPTSVIGEGRVPPTNTLLFDMASDRLGENLYFSLDYTTVPLQNYVTKTIPLNVVGINKFRTYSMDVSDVSAIDKLYFTVENSDVVTNYYIDNMRFY